MVLPHPGLRCKSYSRHLPAPTLPASTYIQQPDRDGSTQDAAIRLTHWQAAQFPETGNHLRVIFDGCIERLPLVSPESRLSELVVRSGEQQIVIPEKIPLVTYVTRCFEHTGWPQVAEGLPAMKPRAHVLSLIRRSRVRCQTERWPQLARMGTQPVADGSESAQYAAALGYEDYLKVIQRSCTCIDCAVHS